MKLLPYHTYTKEAMVRAVKGKKRANDDSGDDDDEANDECASPSKKRALAAGRTEGLMGDEMEGVEV